MRSYSILGPKGTFSHQVFVENFERARPVFESTIRDVFESVTKNISDFGIVPLENSIGGSVGVTMDCLLEFDLNIIQEILLPIRHNLAGFTDNFKKVERIFVHPQTYAQCEMFIRKNLKNAQVINTVSNSESAKQVIEDEFSLAIVPKVAAMIYALPIIKSDVQDNINNATRFIVISKEPAKKTADSRTSISLHPMKDKAGLLYDILGHFAQSNINLTKIESRPTKGKIGDYLFFIDFQGSISDPLVKDAMQKLSTLGKLKIYGSYKRSY